MGISALFGRRNLSRATYLGQISQPLLGQAGCPARPASPYHQRDAALALQTARIATPYFAPKIADYFLYEPAGGGGMGSVYKAVLNFPEQLLAVKVLCGGAGQPAEHPRAPERGSGQRAFPGKRIHCQLPGQRLADDEYFTVLITSPANALTSGSNA